MSDFQNLKLIGEGTFGRVYHATKNNKNFAIKKIEVEKGLSSVTIRELKFLKSYKNKNILELKKCYINNSSFFMILEYCPFDLSGLFLSKYEFKENQIKNLIFQLLNGLSFIHSLNFIHRDIKSSNILLKKNGILKIADFGLTKNQSKNMTNQVCTLWYRAPELLLGENDYNNKIDSWSVGCIFIEFRNYTPFFNEIREISQIKKILTILGAPEQNYKFNQLLKTNSYKKSISWEENIEKKFGNFYKDEMLLFLGKFLQLDYDKRISCKDARNDPIFKGFEEMYFPIIHDDIHDTVMRNKMKKEKEKNKM